MKALYLDCFSGISGNMLLGAFLQAGMPEGHLRAELSKLPIGGEYKLTASHVKKNGIAADYVEVALPHEGAHADDGTPHAHEHHEPHEHGTQDFHAHAHDEHHEHHGHHGHDAHDGEEHHHHHAQGGAEHHHHDHHHHDDGDHGHHGHHEHVHRTMADIRTMLEQSSLDMETKKKSLLIFEAIAEAEGKVHGLPPDEVHFHEVGAVDSIVDIVGTAICLDYFDVEKIFVSKINTGSGFVECAHGTMMVPAPATAELLRTFPTYHSGAEKELATPTGAAVVKALSEYAENLPPDFVTEKIAYGAGSWDLGIPNVLRVYFGEYQGKQQSKRYLIELNIDDMSPQIFGYVSERLLEAGALDVWTTPIFMKKNRPAQQLSVLTEEAARERCIDIIFQETSSIGMRVMPIEQRVEAARRTAAVETKYGEVSCKISAYKGHIVSVSAEYEDCRRLAIAHSVPLKRVQQEALDIIRRRLGE